MKIIITGGAGFIGSHLVKTCVLQKQHHVMTIDCLTYAGHLENLAEVITHPLHQFEKINIIQKKELLRIFSEFQPDWVIHLAAESHVDRSLDNANDFVITNIEGTYQLLDVSLNYWQSLPNTKKEIFRFLHVSTDEVFGALGLTGYFNEHSNYAPNSPYAATKASSDMLARAYYKTYGLPVLISNCSNNYGPHQYPEKLIPLCLLNALDEKPLPLYGNGEQIRDWLFVEDHIQALLRIIENGRIGEIYCVGSHTEKTNIEIATLICRRLDEICPRRKNQSYQSLITFVKDRPGHDQRYAIDAKKMQTELHWTPKISFEKGLSITIDWYLNNQTWIDIIHKQKEVRARQGLAKVAG